MNARVRSSKKELLDADNIPFADIQRNMQELNFINTHLGGHAITIKGFKEILQNKKQVNVCEIGCGGGDNLRAIYDWCVQHKIDVQLTGIDYNKDCIAIAGNCLPETYTTLIVADYKTVDFTSHRPDIIFSSLFCHHFTEKELVYMLRWMQNNAAKGFFINELHRHPVAYYAIKFLTVAFSKSYLVKNDAPLSVARGFIKKDWIDLLAQAGIASCDISWQWAFRWLLTSSQQA